MTPRPVTLLVVEGAEAPLAPLCAALEAAGYALARRGELPAPTPTAPPPGLDGVLLHAEGALAPVLDWLRRARGVDAWHHVPVWLCAEAPGGAEVQQALEAGADDVLCAPWAPGPVLARVARGVRLKRQVDTLCTQVVALAQESTTDGMTGLHNHRFFQARLQEEFRRAQRYDDALALVLVDLDHFKAVNDTWGHPQGDEVLAAVACQLRRSARDTDFVCRYGGEEFALLLPRTSLAGALTLAERAREALQALRLGPQGQVRVSASLGLASTPHRTLPTPEALLRAADGALYRAKHAGRNRVCLAHGLVGLGSAAHGW